MKISITINRFLILISLTALFTGSCTKGIIDKKPNQAQVVPTTLADFQALLDNTDIVFGFDYLSQAEAGAGDFYLNYMDYQALGYVPNQTSLTWQKDIWQGTTSVPEWDSHYKQVFYANVVLDGLQSVASDNSNLAAYNQVKGTALFLRAEAFYNVAQLFAKPYDPATSDTDPGIPLRLNADLNEKSTRSTVAQTYDQITSDLTLAIQLLPAAPVSVYRPAKAAASGLLARVYLAMGKYDPALQNADACLKLYSNLLDYNTLDTTITYPILNLNTEVVYRAILPRSTVWERERGKIDSNLYRSYARNDMRRPVFFLKNGDGSAAFKGMYSGGRQLFSGITTDEQYLIRAECYARSGQTTLAMSDLNTLLAKRFKTGAFVPYIAVSADDALKLILTERRKELILRGLRWTDLRRLNKDTRFAVTLSIKLNGIVYSLPPNDPRYVLPIPDYIIASTGMEQNVR